MSLKNKQKDYHAQIIFIFLTNKKNIVQGVFDSVLCYCFPLFGGCSKTDVQLLQVFQTRAAQVVLRLPPRTGRALMIDKLDWLTVQ